MIRRKRVQHGESEEVPTFTPCSRNMRASKRGRFAIACPLWNQWASSMASCGVVLVTWPEAFAVQASHWDKQCILFENLQGVMLVGHRKSNRLIRSLYLISSVPEGEQEPVPHLFMRQLL